MKKLIKIFLPVVLAANMMGQDPQFTQFFANPMYLNPAFSGLTEQHRFAASYRNQWPGIKKTFSTYMAAYDRNLDRINSGMGAYVMQDVSGTGNLVSTSGAINYAYKVRTGDYSEVRGGLMIGAGQKKTDHGKLLFNDQLITGAPVSEDVIGTNTKTYLDLGAGVAFSSDNFKAGFAARHINRPNVSLLGNSEVLPLLLSSHAAYQLVLKANDTNSVKPDQAINFVLNYRHELSNNQLDVGAAYVYKMITAGVYYRGLPLKQVNGSKAGTEGVAVMAGMEVPGKNLKIMYSYDFTLSSLNSKYSGGAHEINLIYEMWHKKKFVKKKTSIRQKF